jgi:protoheme IX farnesyltransferase
MSISALVASVLYSNYITAMINPKTAMFGAISIFYTSVYSVKNGHIIIRFWGFSGSYSVYVRLVAATGDFGIEAGTLFLIQFFGNSPFLQLVRMKIMKAGFLCCQQAKESTALQVILYTGWLIIASLLPSA